MRKIAEPRGSRRRRESLRNRAAAALALVVDEEEALVSAVIDARNEDRTSPCKSKLVLAKWRYRLVGIVEEILRVEHFVSEELEQASVKSIRPGFGGHVDEGRRLSSEFRRIHRLLNLEFAYRFHRRADDEIVEIFIGDLHAVE